MNLSELFRIKEELLKDLDEEMAAMNFNSLEEREKYYNTASMSIMKFYVHSMISIIDKSAA